MTLAMPDSVRVADLPPGYDAYLGYADGLYPTAKPLYDRFPGARRLLLTVTGATLAADGIDCEPRNPNAFQSVAWAARKLAGTPASRPVIYASVAGSQGYGMHEVLYELDNQAIPRTAVRLLTAHWTSSPHICGPGSCGALEICADGTQWTGTYVTRQGAQVDMSMLADDFFGQPGETERIVKELGIVRQGDSGDAVRTVQGLCNARLARTSPDPALLMDGVFGPKTFKIVATLQARAKTTADGVVGPQTWPVLLGVAG